MNTNVDKKSLRIVYMGTPEISAGVLRALIENDYQVVGVIAQPDRPIGRKQILEPVPTKKVAMEYQIPVFQPLKIRKDFEFVKELKPDLIITLAYGQIVPNGLLEIPRYGCLNLHGSLLPRYRGAAPIQYALINNEEKTGMTLMQMIDKMDAGKMYATKEVKIDNDNATSLFKKMEIAARDLILESLPLYIDGKLPGIEQDESLVTFAPSIKTEEEHLDLGKDKKAIVGYIRGLSDEPGAYLLLDKEKIKIFAATVYSDEIKGQVGEIVQMHKSGLLLQCKDGLISLLELQREGKKRLDYKSFVNGNQNLLHKVLS